MVVCNFCNKRESRARHFSLPFTCKECENNYKNYATDNSMITFMDKSGKEIKINNDTEIILEKTIDVNDYKDSLLASLYSQVEFLRNELNEKNLLIRTLIIRDREINYNDTNDGRYKEDVINDVSISANVDEPDGSRNDDSKLSEVEIEVIDVDTVDTDKDSLLANENVTIANDTSFLSVFNSTLQINNYIPNISEKNNDDEEFF